MESTARGPLQDHSLFYRFSWHVPGVGGMFGLLAWLLLGALFGNVLTLCLMPFGQDVATEYGTIIAYPVMFIPAMIHSKLQSRRNMMFETGYTVDSSHFGKGGAALTAILCMLATVCLAFDMDAINSAMPPMPEWLETALSSMTEGNFMLNFLSVSIFAPLFEEWLCRGTVLRGLLNYRKADGSCMNPYAAIVVSALFFAAIHLNPWQAIPAFAIGCLMGYVYYRTGSLKLTMLMHFANNTLALCAGQSETLSEYDSWKDFLPGYAYWTIFAAGLLFLVLFARYISRIETAGAAGNCDEIPAGSAVTE